MAIEMLGRQYSSTPIVLRYSKVSNESPLQGCQNWDFTLDPKKKKKVL